MAVNYFKKIGARRLLIMIMGNVFLGMGISIFKLSGLGNDPFSGMVMALANILGFSYASFLLVINGGLFIFELAAGRRLIGIGTLVNAFLLGYIVTFFNGLWPLLFPVPDTMLLRVVTVLVGVIVTSFGVSLYQTPNAGVAPYDSISLITAKSRPLIPYFWHRIATDAVCAVICFLAGGIIGLGTLVSAFGLGPMKTFAIFLQYLLQCPCGRTAGKRLLRQVSARPKQSLRPFPYLIACWPLALYISYHS